ncbi:MAG TPA: sigma-70 family RNA polymerase sigma factor [Ktedonobacterales bacterium]
MDEMDEHATTSEWLGEQFEANRGHLRAVAYRMLGSASEADDAVQESWLRLSRVDADEIEHLGKWLTTVVARVCLDMLRSRTARREDPLDEAPAAEQLVDSQDGHEPEEEALMADALGPALLVVLETLNPSERLAFVLHDIFDVPFDEIAPIVGRTPTAARQLASRARRRVQGQAQEDDALGTDLEAQRAVVEAFLAASRNGDFAALLAVLDPNVELRAGEVATRPLAPKEARGAEAVAQQMLGRATGLKVALVGGAVGAVWAPRGKVGSAFAFTIVGGKITAIDIVLDPSRLRQLNPRILTDADSAGE